MKHIQYSNIEVGTFGYFYIKDNTHPEVYWEDGWHPGRIIFSDLGIMEVPQSPFLFETLLHVSVFIVEQTKRDGYYLIAHRASQEESAFLKLYNKELDKYFTCFGIAYSPTPFYVKPRQYEDKPCSVPTWLRGLNPNQYHISQ